VVWERCEVVENHEYCSRKHESRLKRKRRFWIYCWNKKIKQVEEGVVEISDILDAISWPRERDESCVIATFTPTPDWRWILSWYTLECPLHGRYGEVELLCIDEDGAWRRFVVDFGVLGALSFPIPKAPTYHVIKETTTTYRLMLLKISLYCNSTLPDNWSYGVKWRDPKSLGTNRHGPAFPPWTEQSSLN